MRQAARIVREYEGVMTQLVDRKTLNEGEGQTWNEISYAKLTASAVTETTRNENPQQITDTLFTVQPTMVQISTFITDKVGRNIAKVGFAQLGPLAMNAIVRKMDEDGLNIFAGAGTTLAGTGTTLTSGHISAGMAQIRRGGGNEPSNPPWRHVLQSFQLKDIQDELVSGVGTYPIPDGATSRAYSSGFYQGPLFGGEAFVDDLITIDSSTDARGASFAKEAIVLVMSLDVRTETRRQPGWGGGGNELFITQDYAYGERSSGNWLIAYLSDATAPTS
jgi:hypothetical protein